MRTDLPRHGFRTICCVALLLLLLLGLTGCGEKQKNDAPEIISISDLNGKIVVMQMGTIYGAILKENPELPDTELVYSVSQADSLAMLLTGRADAYVTDYVMAQTLLQRYDELKMLDETLDKAGYGFAFRKDDPLQEEFSTVIRNMKADGRLAALTEKWLSEDTAEKTIPEQNWPGSRGTLNCQVSPEVEPLCYPNGTEMTGLDVDLLLQIARELDYHLTFTSNNFYDMLPSLIAKQTDIVASGLTVTAQRVETADFTEEYLDASTVVLVRSSEAKESKGFFVAVGASIRRVFIENEHWKDLLMGLVRTILLTVLTVTMGLVFGSLLFLLGYTQRRAARHILAASDWLMTMMPTSTWLLIMFYIVFSGRGPAAFLAAATALTIIFGFSVYRSLRSNVGGIDVGQSEAAYSMGYSRFKALRLILLPQALPGFLSDMESTVVFHVKDTSLVGLITVLDIQQVADLIRAETMDPFLTLVVTAAAYILLGWGASSLVGSIRLGRLFTERTEEQIRERLKKGKIG